MQTVQSPEAALISGALRAYWADANATLTISSEARMASVFLHLATEISSWAPPESGAELPRRTVHEVADRLRSAAALYAATEPTAPLHTNDGRPS